MAHPISRKNWIMILIGILSLGGLLSYTFTHTGNLLASYVNPPIVGFAAAAGIELSIVGLSMRIGELKKAGLSTRFFWGTLIAVVVVSAFANIAEGYLVKFGKPLVWGDIGNLDIVQAVVSFAATGLISLVTLALSELVGQDVITIQKAQKKNVTTENEDGGYTVTAPVMPELPSPEEKPQLPAPQGGNGYSDISQEDFNDQMNAMSAFGNGAPKSISAVMEAFHLSHATAQRRLAGYRKLKNG